MRVKTLDIKSFRNVESIEFEPCEGANIIFGDNAQGKTNLLESVWLFSGSKSFRGSKDSEFTMFGASSAKLELGFYASEREQTASICFNGEKKTAFLNEIKQESVTKLAGRFCVVVFSPDHLSLVKQGPDRRRKLIDISLCQAHPKYIKILDGYNRALKQRNTLLKDIPAHPSLYDTLEVWDESIISYGAYITAMRARYVKKLAELAAKAYDGISSGRESFSALYVAGIDDGHNHCGGNDIDGNNREDVLERMRTALEKSRADDVKHGATTVGPHRDDIEILVGGVSAKTYGSQGQQRSCVLALKLAECEILYERNSEPPVILLDDVMSELDQNRRDYLLNQLRDKQTFITCCDAEAFSGLDNGRIFQIKAGKII